MPSDRRVSKGRRSSAHLSEQRERKRGDVMRRRFWSLLVSVAISAVVWTGAARAVPSATLSAAIDRNALDCSGGLRVSGDASIGPGGAFLRDASLFLSEVRTISSPYAAYDQTWGMQSWSSRDSWTRSEAVSAATTVVDPDPSSPDWDEHFWRATDATSAVVVGTPNGWWEIYYYGLRRVPGAVGPGERLDLGRLLDWKPGRHRPEESFSYRVVQPEVRRRGQL